MDMKGSYAAYFPRLLEHAFFKHFRPGLDSFFVERNKLQALCNPLGLELPANLSDWIGAFRDYHAITPRIAKTAPANRRWVVRASGRNRCRFTLAPLPSIRPSSNLLQIEIPDVTPDAVNQCCPQDESGLLIRLQYNGLVTTFVGITCSRFQELHSQGHRQTADVYLALDHFGNRYVFPVQATSAKHGHRVVDIRRTSDLIAKRFPNHICRVLGAQFLSEDAISIYEFMESEHGLAVCKQAAYRLLSPSSDLTRRKGSGRSTRDYCRHLLV